MRPVSAIAGVALAIAAVSAGVETSTPARATVTYSRASAVNYAHTYACNLNTSCRNSSYVNLDGSDSTNFVSQVLRAGGIPDDLSGQGFEQWWYVTYPTSWSNTWSHAYDLNVYLQANGYASASRPSLANKFSGANANGGDVYLFDMGKGEGWSHTAFSTGHETYYPFFDSYLQVNYSSLNGGSGDAISQHAYDRDHAPWNIGYLTEPDPLVRVRMRVVLLSMH
ncbi:MAG: hypothetical protein RLZZ626_972 [Actinomycetota bacterium]|jgi:hypothetical protein